MGFYSFYRILKDIIRTIFGSKFWKFTLIVLILFTIFFIMGEKGVFASSTISVDNSYVITNSSMDEAHPYFCVIRRYISNKYVYGLYYCDVPFMYREYNAYNKIIYPSVSGSKFYFPYASDGLVLPADYDSWTKGWADNTSGTQVESYQSTVVLSNHDILNYNGTTFFAQNVFSTKYPEVLTSVENLSTLNFDVISINAWDFSEDDIDVLFYDLNYGTDTTESLYPKTVITLNQNTTFFQPDLTSDPTKNAIYWIPNTETGLNFVKGSMYGIRIAKRDYAIHGGGGFRGDDYIYEYLTDLLTFTISDSVSNDVINSLNMSTKEKTEQKQHDETLNALNNQSQQNQQFYNNVFSNNYNENQPGDTLNSMGGGFRDSVDDTSYVGLFSTVVSKFATIINGDYTSVDEINLPMPHSDKFITLKSNLLSSYIEGTFIYQFLQIFWTYLFGMYIFKFSYGLIKAIKTGSILNGYSWENEAITSSML